MGGLSVQLLINDKKCSSFFNVTGILFQQGGDSTVALRLIFVLILCTD